MSLGILGLHHTPTINLLCSSGSQQNLLKGLSVEAGRSKEMVPSP